MASLLINRSQLIVICRRAVYNKRCLQKNVCSAFLILCLAVNLPESKEGLQNSRETEQDAAPKKKQALLARIPGK